MHKRIRLSSQGRERLGAFQESADHQFGAVGPRKGVPGGRKALVFLAALAASLSLSAPASATTCDLRKNMVAQLAESFGEAPVGAGLRDEGAMFEVWAAPDTGTWTLLLTMPDGTSCLLETGDAWVTAPVLPAGVPG